MFLRLGCKICIQYTCIVLIVLVQTLANQCVLQDGQCTYNILLSHQKGECSPGGVNYSDQQNDNSNQHVRVSESDLEVVKTNHEDRILELEASVQKLLRDAVPSGPRNPGGEVGTFNNDVPGQGPIQQAPNRTESSLLSRLSREFSTLREELREKTMALLEKEARYNETIVVLREAQEDLLDTGEELILVEHKSATLQREGYILKNQLKDKSARLEVANEDLNISETKLRALEIQLYTLVRSEANLKEELGYYIYKFNKTEKALNALKQNHTDLKHRHARTKRTLRKTEEELMDCYAAKTQTFCGFETKDVCGFVQENTTDDFNWVRARVQTPSSATGPTGDHTCGAKTGGHFMYIEASGRRPGQTASLLSVKYRSLTMQCVEFYYHMYGRTMGTLNVYTKTESVEDTRAVWRTHGNQGDTWILARLVIPEQLARIGYQIVFEGIIGRGYQGDMAIDDIKVTDGVCPTDNRAVAVPILPPDIDVTPSPNATETDNTRRFRRLKRIFRTRRRRRMTPPPAARSPFGWTTSTPSP
ncbi:uncharacterized protein LOC110464965 [Mizuhopecten yessoensis]|uniref:MAM domain-containing glycosylphosphatidylinositol anchor protein 1 n=1 Tax=Mizuhopecten yessoensis TaxID=6573 RepID=A0A210R2G2_MIZYE|nr:uncharacterized protein LOC110464965 [Mizuhopecten yessoensis]OWF55095.1 MAM domain-containing glycosylphosphatidylinositol anchor protein 1 [Mizuhopecten yessoensis]